MFLFGVANDCLFYQKADDFCALGFALAIALEERDDCRR